MAFKWAKERLKGGPKDQESLFFLENIIIESIGSFIKSQIIFSLPSHPLKKGKKKGRKKVIFPASSGDSPTHFFHIVAFYGIPLNIFISLHPCLHYVQICPFLVKNNPWVAFDNDICL